MELDVIIIFSYFLLSAFYLGSNRVFFFFPFFASFIPVLGSALICAHKVIFLPPTPTETFFLSPSFSNLSNMSFIIFVCLAEFACLL